MEKKESTKKLFGGIDTQALKKYFGKKITELQEEKRIVQKRIVCWQKLRILPLILMGTQKESEKKPFGGIDSQALKQHFGKKKELCSNKGIVCWQKLRILLLIPMGTQKMQDILTWKLKALEAQIFFFF